MGKDDILNVFASFLLILSSEDFRNGLAATMALNAILSKVKVRDE